MKEIISEYAKKYPMMRPQDAVLLIYENEYGPGKLKGEEVLFRASIKKLYAEAQSSDKSKTDIEDIGNEYVRVYLNRVDASSYNELEESYINSAKESKGGHYFLAPKLYELIDAKNQGEFAFTMQELEEYLMEYEALDYPMPEHSMEYSASYDDKYCVISSKYLDKIKIELP